jgi:hypothetical protein
LRNSSHYFKNLRYNDFDDNVEVTVMSTLAAVNVSDRRSTLRVVPDQSEPINININGENFIEILKANDIGVGGVGITVPHGFRRCNLNELVSFIIELPIDGKKKFIKVNGVIKHLSGDRFGVAFKNVPEMAKFTIRNYIAAKIKKESLLEWMRYKVGLIC